MNLWIPTGAPDRTWGVVALPAGLAATDRVGAVGRPSAALALVPRFPHVALIDAAERGLVVDPLLLCSFEASGAKVVSPGSQPLWRWLLLDGARRRVRVNGLPLMRLRVLADRDELTFTDPPGLRMVFTTERPARVESMAPSASIKCARCRRSMMFEEPSAGPSPSSISIVRCPSCAAVHHQHAESPCWTGFTDEPFATCAVCEFPARLDGRFRWMPD